MGFSEEGLYKPVLRVNADYMYKRVKHNLGNKAINNYLSLNSKR